ncbi:MAG: hypothetical protein KTQ49_06415, partial [Candidatus Omnitrophica bacterium]|nr:hypothetical protein [Candidatus Omnitrophota bacterium]
DDRMILRKKDGDFRIHGTWSHGEVPEVSSNSAPLRAILFLEKAPENRAILVEDKKERVKRLLACLIRPFVTADWWEKTLTLVEEAADRVPCYVLRCDKSGRAIDVLRNL